MTAEWWGAVVAAAWAGLLTAISPCPMATNIAAISFISRKVADPRAALVTGLLYSLGRSIVYVAIAAALVSSLLSASDLSISLQVIMNKVLGPLLILVGMILLNLVSIPIKGAGWTARFGQRVASRGVWSGFALGIVFALSFCPASAALYFAGLIPLAIKFESSLLLPLVFGLCTALPVVCFAALIAFGANAVAGVFNRIAVIEKWARRATGVVFVVIGVYFCLAFIFKVVPASLG